MSKKLPDFSKMSDKQIAEFWDTHDVTEYWDQLKPVKEPFIDKRPKKAISMRFDEDTLQKLKIIAESKGIGYQTLIRMWIKERLKKEAS